MSQEEFDYKKARKILDNPNSTSREFHDAFCYIRLYGAPLSDAKKISGLAKRILDLSFNQEELEKGDNRRVVEQCFFILGNFGESPDIPLFFDSLNKDSKMIGAYNPPGRLLEATKNSLKFSETPEVKRGNRFLDYIMWGLTRVLQGNPRESDNYSENVISVCFDKFRLIPNFEGYDKFEKFRLCSVCLNPLTARLVPKELGAGVKLIEEVEGKRSSFFCSYNRYIHESIDFFKARDKDWLEEREHYALELIKRLTD